MSNDLTELTATELDAVSGGKDTFAVNMAPILTQVNTASNTAAVVNLGGGTTSGWTTGGNFTQSIEQNGNTVGSGSTFSSTLSGITFSGISL
jgi:hypothetical protein